MRTASQEVAPQIALRDCAKEVGRGRSVCRGSMHFPPFCYAATEICGERWTTVTAQFYLESKGKYMLEAGGLANSKDTKRRPWLNFSSSFYMYFFSPSPEPVAAAAAKSLQSCPTLCHPIDGSPPGSPVPGILQARTLEWVAISFSNA